MLSTTDLLALESTLLLAGMAFASYQDWRVREVSDSLWIIMAVLGGVLLEVGSLGSPWPVYLLNVVAVLFVLEHLLPWEDLLGDRGGLVWGVEIALYVGVLLLSVYTWFVLFPHTLLLYYDVVGMVLLARVLFEVGALYGGADAKALMAASAVLPVLANPLLLEYPARVQGSVLALLPFPFTMLIDGALLTLLVPLIMLIRNLRRGEREFPKILHMERIPTPELADRFVWLKDPPLEEGHREDSTEEDQALRARQVEKLKAMGVERVWVTPQLPFLISLALGAALGVLVGDVLVWFLTAI
ncbi:membrane protein containing Peptidase A24A, prepilin type IV [mine drainage metagenome]|uniref:Membrane protein containing Peptidase A24A, prepilin type IV n=1 Tax=mine drainage metagenome TaxID=410659 RepID=T1DE21_9ZZZZ